MNLKHKRPTGRRLIKKYEHGGPHKDEGTTITFGDPTKEELEELRQFNTRRQQSVSKDAMDFLSEFYSQPGVRQKIAANLAAAPGGMGPAPETKETETYQILAKMYPNRIDEMSTYEGLANVVADHYGDFSASMGNFTFGVDPDKRTSGFVDYFPSEVYDDSVERHPNAPRSRSGTGRATKPFTMGLRPFQERMNEQVQVDPYAPTSTYIHEFTHAADIMNNPGNAALMDKYRKKLNMRQSPEEFQKNFESLSEEANRINMDAADFLAYVGKPTETLARLNAIRYDMIKEAGQRGEEANPMDYEYAYDDIPALMQHGSFGKGYAFRQLAAVYGAENVVEMLNEIY